MKESYVVIDVETQKSFDEVGGRDNFSKLGISVAGVYRHGVNRYEAYEEKELGKLNQILSEATVVVGFNTKGFDYTVLQPYLEIPLQKIKSLDIMDEIKNIVGHRVSLNSVAKATLGQEKNGDGLEAIRLYRAGEIEKIKTYCLNDVRLTKEVYEFALKHHYLKYLSKDGLSSLEVKLNWAPPIQTQAEQILLF